MGKPTTNVNRDPPLKGRDHRDDRQAADGGRDDRQATHGHREDRQGNRKDRKGKGGSFPIGHPNWKRSESVEGAKNPSLSSSQAPGRQYTIHGAELVGYLSLPSPIGGGQEKHIQQLLQGTYSSRCPEFSQNSGGY